MTDEDRGRPPRDNIVRATFPGAEVRDADGDGLTLFGHFARFNEWTRISSALEGTFMERIAPGSFTKTLAENRSRIKITLNHGQDPQLGDKPIAVPGILGEDERGAFHESPLLDGVPPLVVSGLRAGAYGSSFRFRVTRDDFDKKAKTSDYNPDALPERTIREVELYEFGPVTFPAYAGATAGVRSLTDDYYRHLIPPDAPSADAGAEPHLEPERRDDPEPTPEAPAPTPTRSTVVAKPGFYRTRDEMYARESLLKAELNALANEYPGTMPTDRQAEFDDKRTELTDLEAQITKAEDRAKVVAEAKLVDEPEAAPVRRTDKVEQPRWSPQRVTQIRQDDTLIRDVYDFAEIRTKSRNPEHEVELLRSSALRAIDGAELVHTRYANRAECGDALDQLIREDVDGETSRRILGTGSPAYRRFWHAYVTGQYPSGQEARYAALTGLGATTTTGGFATVYELDPTIMPTSNGAVNPYRSIARVVKTNNNEWRAVTSTGTVAVMVGEATAVAEGGPTLAQPAAIVQKAHGYVSFSIEAGEDIANLDSQLGEMFVDAKDLLEAQKFTTGAGTTIHPQGITIGAGASTTASGTTTVLAAADLYAIEGTLAPRFRPNAAWLMSRFVTNKIRAIDTAGGAQLFTENLRVGLGNTNGPSSPIPPTLLGYPVAECSEMPATLAQNTLILVFGDFSRYFAIIDKIGLNVELVPLVVDGSTPSVPTGQRGLYFYWRYTSKVLSATAFQILKGA